MGIIYKLTCKNSDKSYIGQTIHTSKHRWNQHIWESKNPQANQSRYLNNTIIKYGRDNFILEDLLECSNKDLDKWEMYYIELYNTLVPYGLNLTKGGKTNQIVSMETRKKISDSTKGKPKNVKIPRKRKEDSYLPKYLKHYKDKKCEGYKISDHPFLLSNDNTGKKSISFTSSDLTMIKKFTLALETLLSLNNKTYIPKGKKILKGIQNIPNGYRVRKKGHPVKTFQSKKYTMKQKLKMAEQYVKIC